MWLSIRHNPHFPIHATTHKARQDKKSDDGISEDSDSDRCSLYSDSDSESRIDGDAADIYWLLKVRFVIAGKCGVFTRF